MDLNEKLQELSEDYGIPVDVIKPYYTELSDIPCVADGEEELIYNCLERIVQDLTTEDVGKDMTTLGENVHKTPNYIISDALFNVYGEESIPYLDDEYKEINSYRYRI